MKKWLSVILVCSLIVNVGLAMGLVIVRGQARSQAFNILADTTQANVREYKYILHELRTRDPDRQDALESFLEDAINKGERAQKAWSVTDR